MRRKYTIRRVTAGWAIIPPGGRVQIAGSWEEARDFVWLVLRVATAAKGAMEV